MHKRECYRCGHTWVPRKKISTVCPKCHSPYYRFPKKTDVYSEDPQ